MSEYTKFSHGVCEAVVYKEDERKAELFYGRKPNKPTINWSSCGEVEIEDAKKFLKALQEAIAFAEKES